MIPRGAAAGVVVVVGSIASAVVVARRWFKRRSVCGSIGFFHPNCHSGGGGERVLWCLVKALLASSEPLGGTSVEPRPTTVVVYYATAPLGSSLGWKAAPGAFDALECLKSVRDRFGIDLTSFYRGGRGDGANAVASKDTGSSAAAASATMTAEAGTRKDPEVTARTSVTAAFSDEAVTVAQRRTQQTLPRGSEEDSALLHSQTCSSALSLAPLEHGNSAKTPQKRHQTSDVSGGPQLIFIPLCSAGLVESRRYPYVTLLLQAASSVLVGLEAILRFTPSVFVETCGQPFTVIMVRALTPARCASYIHYPTISGDMLRNISRQIGLKARLKRQYYYCLAGIYSYCCNLCMDSIVVNSSWTHSHVKRLLSYTARLNTAFNYKAPSLRLVYPPCDLKAFQAAARPAKDRCNRIVSVAQFRPEKNHILQLEAFSKLLNLFSASKDHAIPDDLQLVICGATRHAEDVALLNKLRSKADQLGLTSPRIVFHVNLSFPELCDLMGSSKIGLHTMVDEHFGISVVELLAAGLFVVAHNSGGPRTDILNLSPLLSLPGAPSAAGDHGLSPAGAREAAVLSTPVEIEVEEGLVMLGTPRASTRPSSRILGRTTGTCEDGVNYMLTSASTVPTSPHVPFRTRRGSDAVTTSLPTGSDVCSTSDAPVTCAAGSASRNGLEPASFGFLCSSADGFAEALFRCLTSPPPGLLTAARDSLARFNENDAFGLNALDGLRLPHLLSVGRPKRE